MISQEQVPGVATARVVAMVAAHLVFPRHPTVGQHPGHAGTDVLMGYSSLVGDGEQSITSWEPTPGPRPAAVHPRALIHLLPEASGHLMSEPSIVEAHDPAMRHAVILTAL